MDADAELFAGQVVSLLEDACRRLEGIERAIADLRETVTIVGSEIRSDMDFRLRPFEDKIDTLVEAIRHLPDALLPPVPEDDDPW